MSTFNLKYKGNTPQNIIYQGHDVQKVICNGVIVFDKTSNVATDAEMQTYIQNMTVPVLSVSGTNLVVSFTPFSGKYLEWISENQVEKSLHLQIYKHAMRHHRPGGSCSAGGGTTVISSSKYSGTWPFVVSEPNFSRIQNAGGGFDTNLCPVITSSQAASGSITLSGMDTFMKSLKYRRGYDDSFITNAPDNRRVAIAIELWYHVKEKQIVPYASISNIIDL